MNRGSITVLVISILLLCACAISVAFVLKSVRSFRDTSRLMVEASIRRGVLESAKKLLDFSVEEKCELYLEMNGYSLKTEFASARWLVRIEGGDFKKIIYAEGR